MMATPASSTLFFSRSVCTLCVYGQWVGYFHARLRTPRHFTFEGGFSQVSYSGYGGKRAKSKRPRAATKTTFKFETTPIIQQRTHLNDDGVGRRSCYVMAILRYSLIVFALSLSLPLSKRHAVLQQSDIDANHRQRQIFARAGAMSCQDFHIKI